MSNEALFRITFLMCFFSLLGIRIYFQKSAGNYARGVSAHAGEHLANEVPALRGIRPALGIIFYAALLGWLLDVQWSARFRLPLPDAVRWAGGALGMAALVLAGWSHRSLGGNFRPTLGLQENHQLVQAGPYQWVRHPIYLAFLLLMVSGFLLSANWLLGASGILLLLMVFLLRIPPEEEQLLERFGAQYREYHLRTGSFWPRLPAKG